MISRQQLSQHLTELLSVPLFSDYCPNGLQVEGKDSIRKIVTGVSASQRLIDAAVDAGADALLVHHGFFWKGEPQPLVGIKGRRVRALIKHDINLFAYHLPLDAHPALGNNVQLGQILGISEIAALDAGDPTCLIFTGTLAQPLSHAELSQRLSHQLQRTPLAEAAHDRAITRLAWCTGGAQDFLARLDGQGIDAYITGEVSERTIHEARELGISFFSAGHHATERYGIKALGEYLASTFALDVEFIDIPNPA